MEAGYTVFSCSHCGFGKGFYVGVGRAYETLKDVIGKVHPTRRTMVRTLLDEHTIHETSYEHRIYLCEGCGELRNSFWVKIVYDDSQIYETQTRCGGCQKAMVNLSEQLKQTLTCPCCGNNKLQIAEDLLWD